MKNYLFNLDLKINIEKINGMEFNNSPEETDQSILVDGW